MLLLNMLNCTTTRKQRRTTTTKRNNKREGWIDMSKKNGTKGVTRFDDPLPFTCIHQKEASFIIGLCD